MLIEEGFNRAISTITVYSIARFVRYLFTLGGNVIQRQADPRGTLCARRFSFNATWFRKKARRSSCIFKALPSPGRKSARERTEAPGAKISHITKVPAGSLLREAKRLVKFILVAGVAAPRRATPRAARACISTTQRGGVLYPPDSPSIVVISCFYAPIKSPICFNKLEHERNERARRRERGVSFNAPLLSSRFSRLCIFSLSLSFFSLTTLVHRGLALASHE